MRPNRLTVRAIGPYADEQHVDFDALRADGLFLIHGATGSGKTFLLDALSFALYGEVSGGRSPSALRSDHADPGAEPWAALEFEAQGERWLVERVPPHQRLGLRAASLVDKPARAVLSRRVGDGWSPETTGVKEVGLRVTALVGLTAKQFRQVILLPQGRFEEVLVASSDTREELLKTLFDSVLFESVSLHLDRRAREAADALHDTERDLAQLARQAAERWAEVADPDPDLDLDPDLDADLDPDLDADLDAAVDTAGDDADRRDAPREVGLTLDSHRPDDPPDHHEPRTLDHHEPRTLDRLAARAAHHATAATEAADRADHRAAVAARAEIEARNLAERVQRRDELLARRAGLDHAGPEVAAHRVRAERATAAAALEPARRRVAATEHAAAEARTAQRHAASRLATVTRAARAPVPDALRALVDQAHPSPDDRTGGPGATPAARDLAAAVDAARDTLTVRVAQLDELVVVAERQGSLVRRADAAEHESDELTHRIERARFELAGITVTEAEHREELRAADAAAAQLDGVEASAQAHAARARAAALVADAQAALTERRHHHGAAEQAVADAHQRVQHLRAAHLDGIAAVLAGHLGAGDACLVCGATEHPAPATAAPDAVGSGEVTAAEEHLDAAHRAERAAATEVSRAEAALEQLRAEAGDAASDPDRAVELARSAIALVRSTADIAAMGGELLEQLDAVAQRRDVLVRQIDTDLPRAAAARRDAANLRAQLADDTDLLDQAVTGTSLELARLEAGDLLAAVDALRATSARAERAAAAAADAADELRRQLDPSPFTTSDELATAALDPAALDELTAAVARHDHQRATVEAQLAQPELADLDLAAPPLVPIVAEADAARTEARRANDRRARWGAAADAIAALAARHRALAASFRTERERAEVMVRVADQCMGRVGDKISLQRWVLATYLEEICDLATQRLQTMTSHRYSLRVHRERAARGARSGLDLRVFDAHTGEERSVQSLSGGETFQASLALALAVADSVQQHTGGVHLDALFIDEGFGTLDPHSLELALDELDRLRAGGRTVGIISHVAALRERIRVGVEVTATSSGSSLRVGAVTAA